MSDNERPRDRYREGDSRREPRESREPGGPPTERRNRSRSPRRERGGGRDSRYRSRSPFRRDERDGGRGGRGRGGHDRGRGRDDRRGGGDRSSHRDRSPPKGPRSSVPPPRDAPSHPSGGPGKIPTGPRSSYSGNAPVKEEEASPDVEMKDERQKPEDMDDDTWEMMKVMGFGGFKSTKNTKVPGNDKNFGVRKEKKLEARQYMNRQGGFNRPLSPSRG